MRIGSLFSGIGGFDLGLNRAGMDCVWQVEKDEKCRDILARHWPDVKRYGDVRDVGKRNLETVELVCGGFPCQDLSVAGRREGLAGERSGLWFEFIRIVEEIKPEWVVIENVAGLLSSGEGRDMGILLGGLAKCGYWWAYRVLDSQFWGVPQRRRRVFIVASLTAGCPEAVLFEPEGSPWDTPPSREAGARIAASLTAGVAASGGVNPPGRRAEDDVNLVYQCHGGNVGPMGALRRGNGSLTGGVPFVADEVAGTLGNRVRNDLDGMGTYIPDVALPLANGRTIDHYDESQQTYVVGPLQSHAVRHGHAMSTQQAAETEQLISFAWQQGVSKNDRSYPVRQGDYAGSLGETRVDAVCYPLHNQGIRHIIDPKGDREYASTQETDTRKVLRVLREEIGAEAFTEWGLGVLDSLQQAEVLRPDLHGKSVRPEAQGKSGVGGGTPSSQTVNTSWSMREVWITERIGCASQGREFSEQFTGELRAYLSELSQFGTSQEKALCDLWQASKGIGVLQQALSKIQEIWQSPCIQEESIYPTYGVRRLTPMEAERLQGFPDHWTAGQADSVRYRQLGNAVTVNVVEWIGRRLLEIEHGPKRA